MVHGFVKPVWVARSQRRVDPVIRPKGLTALNPPPGAYAIGRARCLRGVSILRFGALFEVQFDHPFGSKRSVRLNALRI